MKKLLALVLALVMSMSLVTISNAAFKDADKISNKEAVDVMAAVGVLAGYDNGEFGATDTLTRAQACKIIAYLDLGGKTADAIKGSGTVFSDVAATAWYAGYVEYCAGAGYVAGIGGGKFDPNANVTGVQFAKMLLCALGYKAEIEGYTGSDYTIAIARDANKNDLFKSLSIVTSANLTREQAAQMAFNALKATTVEYQGGTNVTTSDGTSVIVNAVRNEVKRTSGKDYRNGVAETANGTQQLVEKLYGADLILTETDSNDFGAPAEKWSYKNEEVGTYASDADATFTKKVTYGDLYTAIGSTAVKRLQAANTGSTLTVKVDNKDDSITAADITKGSSAALNLSTAGAVTGNGVTTSVYVKDSATSGEYDVTIVIINTYVGKVSTVTKATASADRYVNITNKGTTLSLKDNGKFETEALAKDDYVLFNAAWNGTDYTVKTVSAVTKVNAAEVTSLKGTDNFTAAGTTYKYAKTYNASVEIGNEYDLYLDANGYVAFTDLYNGAVDYSNYIVITKDATQSGLSDTIIANAVKMDGTMVSNITLGKLGSNKINAVSTANSGTKIELNKLYSFSVGSDGKYNLKEVAAPYGTVALTGQNSQVSGYKYHTGDTAIGAAAGNIAYAANNATVFVVYNNDKDTVTVYTGIKNMVNIADAATLTSVNALYKTAGIAKLVFINTDATSASTASAKDLVYLLDTTPVTSKDGDDTIYTYSAIVNGETSTIKAKSLIGSGSGELTGAAADQKLYYISSYEDGYVTAMAAAADGTPADYKYKTATNVRTTYADGVFTISGSNGSYVLADDCALYNIDKDGNVASMSVDELESSTTSIEYTVVTLTKDNVTEAVAIYVQKTV